MKMVLVDIRKPAAGDLIIVAYSDPRGGCTAAKHKIAGARKRPIMDAEGFMSDVQDLPAETPAQVAQALASIITKEWMTCFEASVNHATGQLVIKCASEVSANRFFAEIEGPGGTETSISEL